MSSIIRRMAWVLLVLAGIQGAAAQTKPGFITLQFAVSGNCEMCKETIEQAVDVKGVRKANWDAKTQSLTVTFDSTRVKEIQLQEKVAASGYDTEKVKADDTVYANLPDCCHYTRRTYPPKPKP